MSLKKKIVTSIATITLVGALVGGATFALFTDSETSAANFKAGAVDIGVCPEVNVPIDCMAPGDKGQYRILVTNDDCLEFRYDINQSLTGALADGVNGLKVTLTDKAGNLLDTTDAIFPANAPTQEIFVNYELPLDAGNEYAHAEAALTLTFDAEQTANN